MTGTVNPNMLILAREARGYNQKDVSERTGVSVSNISKMENEAYATSQSYLESIAQATDFPLSFFYQQGDILPDATSYRKREKVAQKVLNPIQAKVNIIRTNVQQLLPLSTLELPKLPVIEVTETVTPEAIAGKLRKFWKMGEPVIGNVVELLEAHGILVATFSFGTDRVDSRCMLTEDGQPIIFYNKTMLGDRQRWSLVYELGHLVMHIFTPAKNGQDINHEANLFAAELLMPEKEIKKDFGNQSITVPLLAELKRKWGVSMIALLYRADNLGFLSENQKKYLINQFNTSHIRKREPPELDVPVGKPQLIKKIISDYRKTHKLSLEQTADFFSLRPAEFMEWYDLDTKNA